jgi:hypothetical protein
VAAYEVLLLNTAIPQIQAAQAGDTYVVPRDIAINATAIISANSATDALRITQTGAGNALVVEDSANPDATPFVVTAAGDVGVGTSSPAYKLDVSGQVRALESGTGSGDGGLIGSTGSANGNAGVLFQTNATSRWNLTTQGTGGANLRFYNYALASTVATFDSSGNLGLGVTPSAWRSNTPAFQIGSAGVCLFADSGLVGELGNNVFLNSSSQYIYLRADLASRYRQYQGIHSWLVSTNTPVIGDPITFSTAMTLDASGRLGVGETSPAAVIHANAAGGGSIRASRSTVSSEYIQMDHDGSDGSLRVSGAYAMLFHTNGGERARITSDGNLLVGSPTAFISGTTRLQVYHDSHPAAEFSTGAGALTDVAGFWNKATSGDNQFAGFYTETSPSRKGSITYNRAGGLVAYNTTSDYRAKDIIGPVTDAGVTIDALKVYNGKMKGATVERPMLIAHEAQEVTPYAVTGEKDAVDEDGKPKYQQMDVSSLVPLLIAELQSLRARVAQLESKGA